MADPTPNWKWSEKARRYYDLDAHRFMSRDKALGFVSQSIDKSRPITQSLTSMYYSQKISLDDWRSAMRTEVKNEHIRQYILGVGGRDQMTPADWGRLGATIKGQYKYIDGFGDGLAAGKVSEGQALVRAGMYADSARASYEKGHFQSQTRGGREVTEELWVLGSTENHCKDCPDLASAGWVPIGTHPFPGDGNTECLTNCLCHKEYR